MRENQVAAGTQFPQGLCSTCLHREEALHIIQIYATTSSMSTRMPERFDLLYERPMCAMERLGNGERTLYSGDVS